MAEYLEREALLHEMKMDIRPPFAVVRDFPPADVTPVVHGKWIDYSEKHEKGMDLRCSICNKRASAFVGGFDDFWDNYRPNFCSHCGAKMDLEDEKNDRH